MSLFVCDSQPRYSARGQNARRKCAQCRSGVGAETSAANRIHARVLRAAQACAGSARHDFRRTASTSQSQTRAPSLFVPGPTQTTNSEILTARTCRIQWRANERKRQPEYPTVPLSPPRVPSSALECPRVPASTLGCYTQRAEEAAQRQPGLLDLGRVGDSPAVEVLGVEKHHTRAVPSTIQSQLNPRVCCRAKAAAEVVRWSACEHERASERAKTCGYSRLRACRARMRGFNRCGAG